MWQNMRLTRIIDFLKSKKISAVSVEKNTSFQQKI